MRAWSFSSLNLYYTCPRQYDLTKNKQVIPYTETEATKWGSTVHEALENYLRARAALPGNLELYRPYCDKIISMGGNLTVEWEFALSRDLRPMLFADKNAWCRGIIDVAVIKGNRALLADWKTGKIRLGSDQLKLFAAAAFEHYPQLEEVTTAYIWLNHAKLTKEKYTRADLPAIWRHFMEKVAKLENSYEKDRWVPKPSGLCAGWCGAGANHCEFWSPKVQR